MTPNPIIAEFREILDRDYKGIAKAFAKGDMEWHAKEWEAFIREAKARGFELGEKKERRVWEDALTNLLNKFANTPINERKTGWDWMLKLREEVSARNLSDV